MNAKKKFDHSHDLVLLPFGGTGEIGMNCYAYGAGGGATLAAVFMGSPWGCVEVWAHAARIALLPAAW